MSNTWCPHFIYNLKVQYHEPLHTDSQVKSPQWLHHLQFSGFEAFWSALELSVSLLNWTSLPNKLKCSHTVITLRCKGNLFCMNHKFVYFPCGVMRLEWQRRRDTLLILMSVSHVQIYFFVFFSFKNLLKMEGDNVFRTVECYLCACWSCSHFSTNWKANCSEVDACS